MSEDDTRRAEAFALYNSFIARGWGDGDKAAFASRAEAAIEAAGVFNETWEKWEQAASQPFDADAELAKARERFEILLRERDALHMEMKKLRADHNSQSLLVVEGNKSNDALRAELDAAKTKIRFQEIDLDCARKERDTGYSMAEAAKKRIAELTKWQSDAQKEIDTWCKRALDAEAYKARVEALPVRRYTWADGFTQDSANGRFIPAEEEL